MINKVSIQTSKIQGNNTPQQQKPAFKGSWVDGAIGGVTSVLQFCNTNPMAGVSLIDGVTAIAPRTYVDAKTNGFAAAETFRRESSGLIVNCLIPGFVVLGTAKVLEAMNKDLSLKGVSNMWANQDALEAFKNHFTDIEHNAEASKKLVYKILGDSKVLNGKEWVQLDPESLKTEIDDYIKVIQENVKDKKVVEKARTSLYNKVIKVAGGAEHIKIGNAVYHDNLTTLLRDGVDVGQKFVHDLKCDNKKIAEFVEKSTKFVNKKSLIGLALIIPLAASMQSINRWITKKRSGVDGAPIYKDFVKQETKKEMSPPQKAKFWTNKIGAAGLMVGVAVLSMMKKPSVKMLQFTKNMPSMDQCRWIATATFASRMLAAQDNNELKEVTWRDIATFSSLYFLGDYVAKGVGNLIQKATNVKLLNYTKEESAKSKNPLKNALNKVVYWTKDTKLKSFDEAAAINDIAQAKRAKGLRAMCEVSSLGFSMLLLGILVPWYVRKQTEKKVREEEQKKLNSFHAYPSLNLTSNKKTFQAFGMMEQPSK